jgi:hypothetical protein
MAVKMSGRRISHGSPFFDDETAQRNDRLQIAISECRSGTLWNLKFGNWNLNRNRGAVFTAPRSWQVG